MELEVGEVVLCTVEKIIGTTVFVNVQGFGQGYISLSEIAPGRIRNIRDYVVPKKTIVCKILKISGKTIELSLRRVTPKEQKELKERYKQEKSYKSILKTVLKEKFEEIISKIQEKESIYELLEEAKKDPKELEKIIGETDVKKVLDILGTQKQKKAILSKTIKIHTKQPNGLKLIKELLQDITQAEVKYLSAGKYSIKIESNDIKKADQKLKELIEDIEKKAKKKGIEFISK